MEDTATLRRVSKAVLQDGVDIEVTVASPRWYHRLGIVPKSRTYTIRPSTPGTLIRISEILLGIDYESIKEPTDALRYINDLVNVAALAIENRNGKPSKKLVRYLRDNLDMPDLLHLSHIVVEQMRVDDFFVSMGLMRSMNILKPGQRETPPTSGKHSEVPSNTTASAGMKSCGTSALPTL
jgi:hypothetical protein